MPLDPDTHPHLVEYARDRVMQPGYSFAAEFEPGLALIIDGLERALDLDRMGDLDAAQRPRVATDDPSVRSVADP